MRRTRGCASYSLISGFIVTLENNHSSLKLVFAKYYRQIFGKFVFLIFRFIVLYRDRLHAFFCLIEDLRRNTELHPPAVREVDLDEVACVSVAGLPFLALHGAVGDSVFAFVDEADALEYVLHQEEYEDHHAYEHHRIDYGAHHESLFVVVVPDHHVDRKAHKKHSQRYYRYEKAGVLDGVGSDLFYDQFVVVVGGLAVDHFRALLEVFLNDNLFFAIVKLYAL